MYIINHVIDHAALLCRIQYILATRMAAVHGSLAAFDSTTEEWTEYIERLEFYFAANGITDAEKQRTVLLSCCGPSTGSGVIYGPTLQRIQ